MKPIIAIVGRPNVGKSTLFNRIAGRRAAIVDDMPGVTRDRHYCDAEWTGRHFILIDTGGFELEAENEVQAGMTRQARIAVSEADAVIFVVDAMEGITAADSEVAEIIRRTSKKTVVAANKIDSVSREFLSSSIGDIHGLGLPVIAVSAEHGRGVGDLLDMALEGIAANAEQEDDSDALSRCRVAVIGRPNVGKSTLVNRLIGEERMLATELPGTTRDSVDASLRYRGREYILTDTAGIRRKKNISFDVEKYSVTRAFRAIEAADVAVLMLDANEPAVSQDERLAHMVFDRGKSLVLVVNKWDLLPQEGNAGEKLRNMILEKLPEADHAPVLLVSALEGKRVFSILETAEKLHLKQQMRIQTPDLNRWMEGAFNRSQPPMCRGRPVRLYYCSQIGVLPPKFAIFVNKPEGITEAYRRYLENRLREEFGFGGVPIRFSFRARRRR